MSTDKWRAMPGGGRRLLPYKSIKGIWPHALARPLGLECWACPEGAMHYVKFGLLGGGYGVRGHRYSTGESAQTSNTSQSNVISPYHLSSF